MTIWMFASILGLVTPVICFTDLPSNYVFIILLVLLSGVFYTYKTVFLLFNGFFIGLLISVIQAQQILTHRLSAELEGQDITLSGTISGLPRNTEFATQFHLALDPAKHFNLKKIRLNWYDAPELRPELCLELTVRLKRPNGLANPGSFDYEGYLFSEQIGAVGYVRTGTILSKNCPEYTFSIDQLRYQLVQKLTTIIDDRHHLAFIQALVLGIRDDISSADQEMLIRTGTAHLLAISGLHISLVAWFGYLFVLYVLRPIVLIPNMPEIHYLAAWGAIFSATFYASLAGFSLPTQRALIMLSAIMLSVILKRRIKFSHRIIIALWIIFILNPLSVLSSGFWLSFIAVVILGFIYFFNHTFDQELSIAQRYLQRGKNLIVGQVSIVLALTPVVLYWFGGVSIIAPGANLLAIPFLSVVILPLCFLGIFALLFSQTLSLWILSITGFCLDQLLTALHYLGGLNWAYTTANTPSVLSIALAMFGLWILKCFPIPGRWLAIFLFLPLLFPYKDTILEDHFKVIMLDVGQGLGIVIRTKNHLMIYDTGGRFGQTNMGNRVIVPYLKSQNLSRIDTIMISHDDSDHIGGLPALLKNFEPKQLWYGSQDPTESTRHYCQDTQSWVWDGVLFEVLHPDATPFEKRNNQSCVIKISNNSLSVLIPGDIEQPIERKLIAEKSNYLASHILIAPHHGSGTSSSEVFLDRVNPSLVLISSGYLNRFKHPAKLVTDRYHQRGIQWLNTAYSGTITIDSQMGKVHEFRHDNRRYWHRKD